MAGPAGVARWVRETFLGGVSGQDSRDELPELAHAERLREESGCSGFASLARRLRRSVPGDDDDRDVRCDLPSPCKERQPVHPGHPPVGEDQIGEPDAKQGQGRLAAGRGQGVVPTQPENADAGLQHVGIVIDDQNRPPAGETRLHARREGPDDLGKIGRAQPLGRQRELAEMPA